MIDTLLIDVSDNIKMIPECFKFAQELLNINPSKMAICGGSVHSLLTNNKLSGDIDIFIFDLSIIDEKNIYDKITSFYFNVVSCSNSVITIKHKNFDILFQLVYHDKKSLYDVLIDFDSSHCRCAYYMNKFVALPDCIFSIQTKYALTDYYMLKYRIDKIKKLGYKIINEYILTRKTFPKIIKINDINNDKIELLKKAIFYYYLSLDHSDAILTNEEYDKLKHEIFTSKFNNDFVKSYIEELDLKNHGKFDKIKF